jgi:hypothetical protein
MSYVARQVSDAREHFGAKLVECRLKAGFSIAEASRQLGMPSGKLEEFESGQSIPSESWVVEATELYKAPAQKWMELLRITMEVIDEEKHAPTKATRESNTPEVFLCHSSGDKERVRQLYHQLQSDGVRCWFDEEDLLAGQKWQYEIRRAIKRSKFVLACLSRASISKTGYVQKELKYALDVADEQPEGGVYLIPVRLEECEVPDRLSEFQWVDLFKDRGYEKLLRSLGVRPDNEQAVLSSGEVPSPATTREHDSPVVYSSNDFNVAVTSAIQQAWRDCFGERTQMKQELDFTKMPGGGVDGVIWPVDSPYVRVSFCTFPAPEIKLRSDEAVELLKNCDTPCLIVTRIDLKQWTREAIERAYPPPVQFLQWTGSDADREALKTSLRILRGSLSQSP